MPTRTSGKYGSRLTDYIDGRPYELAGKPGEKHAHTFAPGLAAAREAKGWTVEELAAASGYAADYLSRLEGGDVAAPRIVTSRVSAVLDTTTDAVRGL